MAISCNEGMRIARPQSRLLLRRCAVILCAALVACGRTDASNSAQQPYTWSRDTLVAQPELLRDPATPVARGDVIGRPRFARATAQQIFVSDVSVDRVAVLDSHANVVRWIGTRGGGPGELRGVGHLEILGGPTLLVAEALNGRVSEFTFDGKFVRSLRSRFAAGSVGATARATLAVSRSETHYAALLDSNGDASAALRRPPVRSRDRWSVLSGHDLLAADSARWWVLDQATGDVCVYETPQAAAHCRPLPVALLARLNEYRNRRVALLEESVHQRVRAAPLVKDMVRAGAWLALLLPLPELPMILLDVNDGALTPVVLRAPRMPPWLRSATSAAWDGRSFVVVGDEGIGRLHLVLSSSSHQR